MKLALKKTTLVRIFISIQIILFFGLATFLANNPLTALAEPNTEPLKWAPPELVDPVTINLGTGPTNTTLDNNTDYIINLPDSIKYGRTILSGGRNIHIIGGEIVIPENPGSNDSDKRALQIANNQGIVHIEGVLIRNIHNVDEDIDHEPYDGIIINSPNSVVQIQNVHIQDTYGLQAGFHGDLVQPWGGFEWLRIYNFTGSTGYQGMFLARESGVSYGSAELENIDLTYDTSFGTDGGYLLYLDKLQQCTGSNGIYPISLNEVYVSPQIPRFSDSNETNAVGRSIMPDSATSFGCPAKKQPSSTTGPDWYWPDLEQITDGVDSNGVIKTGLPDVEGDHFVPLGTPGLGIPGIGYESPGYENEDYTEPSELPTVTNPITLSDPEPVIDLVKKATNQNLQSGGSPQLSLTATFSGDVTTGNTIIVAANNYNAQGQPGNITSVTDNYGNTYVKADSINGTAAITNGTRWHVSLWYAKNVTGGSNLAVTVNGVQNSFYSVAAFEYEGIAKVTALGPTDTNFISTSSTNANVGPITTTSANNLIVANFAYPSGSTATNVSTVGSGYEQQHFYFGNISLAAIDGMAATAGEYTPSITWTASQPTLAVTAAFLPEPEAPASFTPTFNVSSPTNNTTPQISFSTTDDLGIDRYEVKVDSGSFSEQTSPYTLPALAEGEHTITVRAYNEEEVYRDGFASIIIDLTDPEVEITSPTTSSSSTITDTTVTVTDDVGVLVADVSAEGGT